MTSIDEITTARCRSPRASTVIYQLDRRQAPSRISYRHQDSDIPGTPMTRRVDNILMSLAPSPFLQSTGYISPQTGPSRSAVSPRDGKKSLSSPSSRTLSSTDIPKQRKPSISVKKDSYWSRRTSIDSTTEAHLSLIPDDSQSIKQPSSTEKRKGLSKLRFRKSKPKAPPIAEAPHVVEIPPQRHHVRDRSLPPTPSDQSPATSMVCDITPPASPARRKQAGDLTKFARQMGVPHDRSPRAPNINTEGLHPPPSSSPPWRNSGISDRSVSPMCFSPPTPIQKPVPTPIDSQHYDPPPVFPTTVNANHYPHSTPDTGPSLIEVSPSGTGSSTSDSHCDLGEESDSESATLHTISDGHHPMRKGGHADANASVPSLATAFTNESEMHFRRPRTPFGEYMLADENQASGGQHMDASLRWLHDLGHEEEGIIVIVREPVKEKWSGEWNIDLHEVISAIRFL